MILSVTFVVVFQPVPSLIIPWDWGRSLNGRAARLTAGADDLQSSAAGKSQDLKRQAAICTDTRFPQTPPRTIDSATFECNTQYTT